MAADEVLQFAQAEFEKSRTASMRLMESLARKLGVRRALRQRDLPGTQPRPRAGGVVAVALAGLAAGLVVAGVFVLRRKRRPDILR